MFSYISLQIHRTPKTHLSSKNMKLNKIQEGFLAVLQRSADKNSTSDNYHNFIPLLLGKDQAAARIKRGNRRETQNEMGQSVSKICPHQETPVE